MASSVVSRGWLRTWSAVLWLLALNAVRADDDWGPTRIDAEWRQRYVMGVEADAYRHSGRTWPKVRANLEAARAQGDLRAELRAAAHYFAVQPGATDEDCAQVSRYVGLARAGGASYERELFDLGAASGWLVETACPDVITVQEMEALARRLGDPARMYYVAELQQFAFETAGRRSEVAATLSRQLNFAIAGFQRANVLRMLAGTDLATDPTSTQARAWLKRAAGEIDPDEFEMLSANIESLLATVESRSNNEAAATAHMERALKHFRSGATDLGTTVSGLISMAKLKLKQGRSREALDILQESLRIELTEPNSLIARSAVFLDVYAQLRTPEAYAKGQLEVQRINETAQRSPLSLARRPATLRSIGNFYASFGQYELAFRAQARLFDALQEHQRLVNDQARVELQERLNVALKDRDNARLKTEAEVQATRQQGWIVAFSVAAAGVVASGIALGVAVRRGRRLAKVSVELADRNRELEQRSASRVQLLAAACHDLRQPAHALGMLAELGSDASRDPGSFTAWLQSVRRSAASLSDMLDELMDLGRLDGGHYSPQLAAIPLAELLQEVMLHFGPLARRKGLTLEAQPVDHVVVSDRHLLRRMLFNLVSNAIRYTDAGLVRVSAERSGGDVQVTVQDTGPGIPQDKLDDVLRDYVRLNPLKAAEGLGIGLSVVRRSAELLGHGLTLASRAGQGTTVTLRLPLSTPDDAALPASAASEVASAAGRVLVLLEDDADVREAMAALLRRWGYRVYAGTTAGAVLRLLAEAHARPALVVTDLHLHGTDGLAEVATLRAALQAPGLGALLVTGDLDAAVVGQAAEARVHVAHKPLTPGKLAELVARLVTESIAAGEGGAGGVLPETAAPGPRA